MTISIDSSSIKEKDNELSNLFSNQLKSDKILATDSNQEMGGDSPFTLLKDLDIEPHKETEELKAFKKEIKEASMKHNQIVPHDLTDEMGSDQNIFGGKL